MLIKIILIVLIFLLILRSIKPIYINIDKENFSRSGLSISDDYCHRLSSIYQDSNIQDPNFTKKLCDYDRRTNIYPTTGNYYSYYGSLY